MFKTCPSCGDEFVPDVVECPDCHVPLQVGAAPALAALAEVESRPAARAGLELAAPVMLRRGDAAELREIGERLAARGVRVVVDADSAGQRLTSPTRGGAAVRGGQLAIYVEEADLPEASLALREWMLASVPGAAGAQLGGPIDACPGCGEPLATDAVACTSCGLEFPPLEVVCPRCGGATAPEAERCPQCGYRPPSL